MVKSRFTECKVGTNKGSKKRELQYVNTRTKTTRKLVVGKRGGISYKSPGAKSRRYMGHVCRKTRCSSTFWAEKARMHKAKKSQRKR